MKELALILRYKIRNSRRGFFAPRLENLLRLGVNLLVGILLFAGAYWFFHYILTYLWGLHEIGSLLMDKVVSLAMLTFFMMLILSNLVISLSTLFKSKQTEFLLSLPTKHLYTFIARFFDNSIYSTWAFLFLALPLLASYGEVHEFRWWQYLTLSSLALIPFMLIPAILGVGFSLLLFYLRRFTKPINIILPLVALVALAMWLYLQANNPKSLSLSSLEDFRILNSYLSNLKAVSFSYMPHVWFSEGLKALTVKDFQKVFVHLFALTTTTIFLFRMLLLLSEKVYFKGWLASEERSSSRKAERRARRRKAGFWFGFDPLWWLPPDTRALVVKDLKIFVREPSQWAQFTILLVLLVLYLVNLGQLPLTFGGQQLWETVVTFANFAFCGFILATLAVRFVFPSISMEGANIWSIGSSPLSLRKLFWGKFGISFVIFLSLAEILAYCSNRMLYLSGLMMVLTGLGIFLMSLGLTSLATGCGAIFASFSERNPGKIASSSGGMLTAVLSLFYVALMVFIVALPVHRYTLHLSAGFDFSALQVFRASVMMLALNLVAILLPLKLGLSSLEKRSDF
jgi:ABC-2 type transport system permease protein